LKIDVEDIPDWKGGFDYCRRLVNHGQYPDEALEVYRGDVLCYTIGSFIEGSRLTVRDNRHGTPKIRHRRAEKVLHEPH